MIYEGCNLYSSNLAATLIFVFLCSVNEIYRGGEKERGNLFAVSSVILIYSLQGVGPGGVSYVLVGTICERV